MYNGYSFTHFYNHPSDSISLSDNYILSMCEDNEGYLWVGTMSGGLNKLNKHTGRFTVYSYDKNDAAGISDNTIWSLAVDKSNNIWAGTNKGINVLNIETGKFKHYRSIETDNKTISSDMVISIFVDNAGEIWCGANNGLAKYKKSNDDFFRYKGLLPESDDRSLIIWTINQNSRGNLLLGTNTGLWEQDVKNENNFNLIYESDSISTIWSLLPVNNNIWIGARSGLWIFKHQNQTYLHVPNIFSNQEQHDGSTWCVFKDNAGIIWAGTDNGILKFKPQKGKFKSINSDLDQTLRLSHQIVNSILVDREKTLWIGTDGGGLNRLDRSAQQFSVFTENDFEQNSLSGNRIWALIQDIDGLIWIGTYGAGLNSYNKNTGQFANYEISVNDPGALSNSRVLALFEDSNGNIWIGTRGGGLNKFNKKTEKFEVFLHNPKDTTSISSNTILSITEDTQGNIFAGTFEGGLCKFKKQNKTFQRFKNNPADPNSLSNNNVWVALFDSKNRMWLGTQGGLNLVRNPETTFKFDYFEIKHGLSSNVIFGIEEDKQGNIWLSTFKGIVKLNIDVLQDLIENNEDISAYKTNPFNPLFKTFEKSDGLAGNEFNQGAYFKSTDDIVYFGGLSGLTYFHPDSIMENDFEPEVILSDFKIFNKKVGIIPSDFSKKPNKGEVVKIEDEYFIPKKISFLKKLVITYRESVFSFGFASLDYTMPGKIQYAYKMENFDQGWNYVSEQNSATYTNLDAGEYIFRVRATNSDGKWSTKEARLEILITPPFWKTTWFFLLMGILFILSLVYTVRRIIRKQKEKERIERERIELQLKTIKNQIDPHFAFNAMNMIGSLVYKGDPDTVYDYFTRFAILIRSTLQDSEKIARTLNEELEFVRNYIEIQKARFKGKFDFTLKIDEETDLETEVPKMIIQTFAENAIKHGLMHKKRGGRLFINIQQKNSQLTISVEDNGIGRKKATLLSKGSTGKGMQIIDQIFTLYNKLFNYEINQQIVDLNDENGNAAGTRVVITISKI